ncbi:hypothetical protein GT037_006229 [Alternaria burnsii]|uniref:Uncharacterized protein n=1 Tax=Alternaria burnsii TaxID=1187904 RepID=A0A8H7EED7_9PLEO|nr:uncharacterized protein GT037_006229 [Alternaria burnsii]KAF7675510.1 hypothetical protein GT037_006229 [Alternaria burnsii]
MKGQIRPRLFDEFIEGRHKLRRSASRWLAGCAARSGVSWLSVGWPTLRSIDEKQEFDLLSSICSAYTVLDGVALAVSVAWASGTTSSEGEQDIYYHRDSGFQ